MIQLSFRPYSLELIHPFTIANFTRSTTPIVLVELKYANLIGYGEASLPPYLNETQESVMQFLSKLDFSHFDSPLQLDEIMDYVMQLATGNAAAKAAIDIALHDLKGKFEQIPCFQMYGVNPLNMPPTTLTIGIDTLPKLKVKVLESSDFKILKIKLGQENDKKMIETIREITDKPLCVDVNQGWTDKHEALEMLHWLKRKNVVFVEQPLSKDNLEDAVWLTKHSPLPIIADEAIQGYSDIERVKDAYHGINIKLMKCSGMREAFRMIGQARKLNLKVLMGCMNESSCANLAAAHLAPLADWVDLDGPFMIQNNPFENPVLQDGKIILPAVPGIGLIPK